MSDFKKFFAENPVFTAEEFKEAFLNGRSMHTLHTQLKRYTKSGYIAAVRRSVYFVKGVTGKAVAPDEYLLASKLAEDAVLAYHTAFDVLGFGHSLYYRIYYLTKKRRSPMTHQSLQFIPLPQPVELLRRKQEMFGVEKVERLGKKILVTGKERTLVDCFDHPEYAGGFEELYRCAEKMPYLDYDTLLHYLELRAGKALFAKIGFYLEQHRKELYVEERVLQEIEKNVPKEAVYLQSRQKGGVLQKRWNLIVPEMVINRKWEEF
jgi:predicted transcriptional regulator of viral defense system